MSQYQVVKTLKYGHDSYIIIEDTAGATDLKYVARMRDGGAMGVGSRPYDAVNSLLIGMTKEADAIRLALVESIMENKNHNGWFGS